MLSLAKSHRTNLVRAAVMGANAAGLLFGVWYKGKTPDLYPGSVHSIVGWIATGFIAAQSSRILGKPLVWLSAHLKGANSRAIRVTAGSLSLGTILHNDEGSLALLEERASDAEAAAPRSRNWSPSSPLRTSQEPSHESGFASGDETFCCDTDSLTGGDQGSLPYKSRRTSRRRHFWESGFLRVFHDVLDRTSWLIAFVALCTGIATFWGLFVSLWQFLARSTKVTTYYNDPN